MNPEWPITATIVLFLLHGAVMAVLSRTVPAPTATAPAQLFFVVLIPCLDEGVVINRTLGRIRESAPANLAVLVIDDGSTDDTRDIVARHAALDARVNLLSRRAPHARQGKGEALNAAFRHVCDSGLVAGRRPDDVVVVVLDADGRPAPGMFEEAGRYFADPRCGAVQVGVRMYNVGESLLARMQDLEFVAFTEVYQRGRMRVGSVALGGNGQFARLSALKDLGRAPWTPCLTEDLDLGLRLLVVGWQNRYCHTSYVAQQAVVSPRRLLRQRTRWFQGNLQCLQRIPLLLRSPLGLRATLDVLHHLLAPFVILLTSLLPVTLVLWFGLSLVDPAAAAASRVPHLGSALLFYGLTFALVPVLTYVYRSQTPMNTGQTVLLAHLYVGYAWLWYVAGWWALLRIARGEHGWAKTARTRSADSLTAEQEATAA